MTEKEVLQALQELVAKYKKYERTEPDTPPKHHFGYWSYRDGTIGVLENYQTWSAYGNSVILKVGVKIGARFGNMPDGSPQSMPHTSKPPRKEFEKEVKEVLLKMKTGRMISIYGSSYSIIGVEQ